MKKETRLRKASDFKKVFREGRRFLSPHFVLYMRENALPEARLGVSISKTHFKLATRRNKLRRIAKEAFRREISPRLKGRDFVVASRAGFLSKPHINEAINELKRLLSELR